MGEYFIILYILIPMIMMYTSNILQHELSIYLNKAEKRNQKEEYTNLQMINNKAYS